MMRTTRRHRGVVRQSLWGDTRSRLATSFLALVIVLSANGLSGIPFGWYGVAGGCVLAGIAFTLGYAE